MSCTGTSRAPGDGKSCQDSHAVYKQISSHRKSLRRPTRNAFFSSLLSDLLTADFSHIQSSGWRAGLLVLSAATSFSSSPLHSVYFFMHGVNPLEKWTDGTIDLHGLHSLRPLAPMSVPTAWLGLMRVSMHMCLGSLQTLFSPEMGNSGISNVK